MEHKSKGDFLALPPLATMSFDWQSYYQMMKPTISMLVVVTVIPALFMAQKGLPSLALVFSSLLGTFMASGSAAVFNHLVDSDLDAYMKRTKSRPIPSGKVSTSRAALFGASMGLMSFAILYIWASPLAAWLAVSANIFYVLGYTMFLKRRTVQNIVIGGAAGCVGPLIGWSAVTGRLDWPAWVLFAIIFLWTPPHFWSLAIKYKDDYARANIPMLPTIKGYEITRRQIFLYTLTLLPAVLLLPVFGAASWIFGLSALAMTLYFVWLAFSLYRSKENHRAMPLFYYSCFYLFGVFGALTIDQLLTLF
ncbi:MAG: heme o synthase [Proteobacteria bacterium]|nr:heme o synthase [Pseudomonadota bacterium]